MIKIIMIMIMIMIIIMIERIMVDSCQQVCFLISENFFRGGISGLILIFKKRYLIGSYL